jgi:hypothetical protein
MIAQATVDCYSDTELATALLLAIQENLALPFRTQILGLTVNVTDVDVNEAGEICALCKHGGKRQRIPLVDLFLPVPPPAGAEWIEAYRRWAARR